MANQNDKLIAGDLTADRVDVATVSASDKPEIADKPSFLKDVKNGLVHVAKTIWQVPAAKGYIATLIVRAGLPAGIVAILVPIIDALVK